MSTIRPLERCYAAGESYPITAAGLDEWRRSSAFKKLTAAYREYPKHSLISDESRALLHHLVVMQRPARVLEIGTFSVGTTEVFARALWEVGSGHIDTIDPYGAERCPPLIERLPAELRERISFFPVNSASYFDAEISLNRGFDLVFIDGNHEFEYALFDLMCTARLIVPGGLVVLDNVDQPGPRFATKMFLDHNPDWHDVAGVLSRLDPGDPLAAPVPSFPHTNLYLIAAPPYHLVGAEPRSFGSAVVDRAAVDGVTLSLADPRQGNAARPRLPAHVRPRRSRGNRVEPEHRHQLRAAVGRRRCRTAAGRPLAQQPSSTGRSPPPCRDRSGLRGRRQARPEQAANALPCPARTVRGSVVARSAQISPRAFGQTLARCQRTSRSQPRR